MQIDVSDYENWIGKTQEIQDKLEISPLNDDALWNILTMVVTLDTSHL